MGGGLPVEFRKAERLDLPKNCLTPMKTAATNGAFELLTRSVPHGSLEVGDDFLQLQPGAQQFLQLLENCPVVLFLKTKN